VFFNTLECTILVDFNKQDVLVIKPVRTNFVKSSGFDDCPILEVKEGSTYICFASVAQLVEIPLALASNKSK
jgi:hypothetical protein